jgi:hypothetical protein
LGNEPVELVFDLLPTSYVFDAGHRIRVTITCADKDIARWLKFKIRAKVKRAQVKVKRRVAPPLASSKRSVTISRYSAPQLSSRCHRYQRAMDEIVAMSVQQGEILVMVIVVITISMMNLQHVRCAQA